jgi:hypothetical protein
VHAALGALKRNPLVLSAIMAYTLLGLHKWEEGQKHISTPSKSLVLPGAFACSLREQ